MSGAKSYEAICLAIKSLDLIETIGGLILLVLTIST